MSTSVLQLKNIYKSFTGNRVLSDINLSVSAGEVLCLVGGNGSGKSTLIKIVSGVHTPDSGSIILNGKVYSKLEPTESIKQGIQVIYQDFSVFPNMTVAENITLGLQLSQGKKFVNWSNVRKQAKKALEIIGVKIDLDEELEKLSVAQKQIVAISRAILQDAKLIIMDEPTTALTNKEIERLFGIIRNLSQRGTAVIFVSHKLDEVFAVSQRIAVIRSGEMIIDEHVDTFQKDKIVYYMTGQEIGIEPFVYEPKSKDPTMQVINLSQKGVFSDISFDLYPGEILGITGQLGSGRTELAKALFGIGKISCGEIRIHGERKKLNNIRDAMKCKIGYVPEDRLTEGLFMRRSLIDNFSAPTIDSKKNRFGLISKKLMVQEAERRVKELSINAKSVDVNADTFSGGNQQRIVIGKWLASDPEILILNGPTVGVDVKSKSEIHHVLKELAQKGLCIILISDDIEELMTTTNRIMVMNEGKMVYHEDTSRIDVNELNSKIVQSGTGEEGENANECH